LEFSEAFNESQNGHHERVKGLFTKILNLLYLSLQKYNLLCKVYKINSASLRHAGLHEKVGIMEYWSMEK